MDWKIRGPAPRSGAPLTERQFGITPANSSQRFKFLALPMRLFESCLCVWKQLPCDLQLGDPPHAQKGEMYLSASFGQLASQMS